MMKRMRMTLTTDILVLSAIATACWYFLRRQQRKAQKELSTEQQVQFSRDEWVFEFPCLTHFFGDSSPRFVGLFFAASWCDDCWEVVPVLEKLVVNDQDGLFSIVYVSSDTSAEEMKNYVPSVFDYIPFNAVEERSNLKRLFKTCAKKELDALGMTDRLHGTPTLIVIDKLSGRVLTVNGVDDIMKEGATPGTVADEWKLLC